MTTNLPSEYKVARFEEAGGPFVITKIKLELPKKGEVGLLLVDLNGPSH